MSLPRKHVRPAMAGFSLIELMVALVAGLIVAGAVLAFTISSIGSNSQFVRSTRLMQELRNSNDYIVSELKRAGYDEAAMDYVANSNSTAVSLFSPILVDNSTAGSSCVIYAYDRQPGNPGKVDADNGEIRGIRRKVVGGVGVIEVAESTSTVTPACDGASPDYTQYPVVCNTTSGWCPLSDIRSMNMGAFTVNDNANASASCQDAGANSNGVRSISGTSSYNALEMREFQITLSGSLISDASDTRCVRSNVKVRADCIRPNIGAPTGCDVAPVPTP